MSNPFANWSAFDAAQYNARHAPAVESVKIGVPVARESTLHREIMGFCNAQWPRWKFRHSRMDKKTCEELGTEDFTIFAPENRTFHFECKAGKGKRTFDQEAWRVEMRQLKHEVHTVHNFAEFLAIVNTPETQP